MQSSTDAGNGGPRKHTQSTAPQKQSEISETTSFTVNANTTTNSQQQQIPGGPASNTPSKNPFKQQLDSNQQNGNMEPDCGIMGVGKEPPVPPPPTYQSQTYAGRQAPPPADQYREEDPRAAGSWAAAKSWMVSWRGSNRLVLVIVAIALLLDNMLLTTVGEFNYTYTWWGYLKIDTIHILRRINLIPCWPLAFHEHLSTGSWLSLPVNRLEIVHFLGEWRKWWHKITTERHLS